jgi:hypothetical protein
MPRPIRAARPKRADWFSAEFLFESKLGQVTRVRSTGEDSGHHSLGANFELVYGSVQSAICKISDLHHA